MRVGNWGEEENEEKEEVKLRKVSIIPHLLPIPALLVLVVIATQLECAARTE